MSAINVHSPLLYFTLVISLKLLLYCYSDNSVTNTRRNRSSDYSIMLHIV